MKLEATFTKLCKKSGTCNTTLKISELTSQYYNMFPHLQSLIFVPLMLIS